MLILLSGLIVASRADEQDTQTGRCVLAKDTTTSPDGRCGTWEVSNTIEKDAKEPTASTVIDFSYVTIDFPHYKVPELPLTIVRVCVSGGHNSFIKDWLIIKSSGSRYEPPNGSKHKSSNQTWILRSEGNEDKKAKKYEFKGCRYLPLRPGMKISAQMTNIKPDITTPGLVAKGTWAIVK